MKITNASGSVVFEIDKATGAILTENGVPYDPGGGGPHTHPISDVTDLQASLDAKQASSEKGQANGYASLGADGLVPSAQLPAAGSGNTVLRKTADQAITSAGWVSVTGLSFSMLASEVYMVRGYVLYQTSTTAMGVLFGFIGPASQTKMRIRTRKEITAAGTAGTDKFSEVVATAYDTANPNSTAEPSQAADLLFEFEGVFVNGANAGTFAVRFNKENVAGTATVMAQSYMEYRKIN